MTGPQILPCNETPQASAVAAEPAAAGRGGAGVLAATILGSSLAFIDGSVVIIALPEMQRELDASLGAMQWVINAYTLFLGALILTGGAAGDRFGRRNVFILGVGLFTAASAACGLAPGERTLILARAVQGVGAALLVPNSLALVSASFGEKERGAAIGTWSGFAALATALGPVLGGWMVDGASWRAIFFINVPLAAVAILLAWRYVPESRAPSAGPPDWAGALLITAGLAAITYALIEAPVRGLGATLVLLPLAAGAALLVAFVVAERLLPAPMVPLDLFSSRTFSVANLLTLLLYFALGGALFLLPFNLIQFQDYSATEAGASLLPFTLIMGVLSRWSGGLADRLGARPLLVAGPFLTALGFAHLGVTGAEGAYSTAVLPSMVLMGLGMTICIPALTAAVLNAAPAGRVGAASGVNNAAARLAGLLAVAGLGLVMLQVYASALSEALSGLALPDAVLSALRPDGEIGPVEVPGGLPPDMAEAVRAAARQAYLDAFGVAMFIAAGFAGVSALAGLLIDPKGASGVPAGVRAARELRE